jgi:hypothetical protein
MQRENVSMHRRDAVDGGHRSQNVGDVGAAAGPEAPFRARSRTSAWEHPELEALPLTPAVDLLLTIAPPRQAVATHRNSFRLFEPFLSAVPSAAGCCDRSAP